MAHIPRAVDVGAYRGAVYSRRAGPKYNNSAPQLSPTIAARHAVAMIPRFH